MSRDTGAIPKVFLVAVTLASFEGGRAPGQKELALLGLPGLLDLR